jgi:hypothetical protein
MDANYQAHGAVLGGYAKADRVLLQQAESRQLEIPGQFGRLESALNGCVQGLETLASRLSESVLRSECPTPANTIGTSSPTAVPQTSMGSRLQDLTNTASILNERIHSLISRLEA